MDAQALIRQLQLTPHIEGGYFRRHYTSPWQTQTAENQARASMSSIYYLLSADSPIGYLHRNRSDILHFWLGGRPLHYTLVSPRGELTQTTLGPDLSAGQVLTLCVPGGHWKACRLSGENPEIGSALATGAQAGTATGTRCGESGISRGNGAANRADYGLIAEAVSPGFDYSDHTLASAADMHRLFPRHWPLLAPLIKPPGN